jgi:hypothetical protein
MKLLVQKSLKTELRLKRYRVLKLYGLKCKISELGTDFLLNRGLNRNLIQAQGVLCKTAGLIQILIYFYKGKRWTESTSCGPRKGGRSTVDSRPGQGSTLAGARLAGAAKPRSSPRVGEKGEELRGSSPRASVADSTARRGRRR